MQMNYKMKGKRCRLNKPWSFGKIEEIFNYCPDNGINVLKFVAYRATAYTTRPLAKFSKLMVRE